MWIKFCFAKKSWRKHISSVFGRGEIRSDNESVQEVVHNKTNVMVMEMFIAKCLDGDLATDYIWPEAFKINSSSTDFILVNEGFSQCIYLCSVHIKKKIKIKIAFEELD